MKKTIRLLLILFIILIFIFSSQSKEESSTISENLLLWLGIVEENDILFHSSKYYLFHNLIRKIAHFLLYLCLGMIGTKIHKKTLFFLIFIPFLDEYLQSFNKGRGSSFFDIFIDLFGLLIGFLFIQKGLKLIDKISDYWC